MEEVDVANFDAKDYTQPGPSGLQNNDDSPIDVEVADSTLETLEFDPKVDSEEEWVPPQPMLAFLEKHFTMCLSTEEREAILKDFPKPEC